MHAVGWRGLVWSFAAGVPASRLLASAKPPLEDFAFVQISDSHIGFDKASQSRRHGNLPGSRWIKSTRSIIGPTSSCIPEIFPTWPRPSEFDTFDQFLRGCSQKQAFFVPGEHDLLGDDGKQYLERFGKGTAGRGWQSFDHKGVHFIGLNNAAQLEGMGALGRRAVGVVQERCSRAGRQHPDRRLRPYSSVGRLSRVGLGHARIARKPSIC